MRYLSVLFLILLVVVGSSFARAQATYTWTGAVDTSWATAENWSPIRTTPAATDTLVFDGNQTNQPTIGVKQTVARLVVIGNVSLHIDNARVAALTATGGTPNAFDVAAGATFAITALGTQGNGQVSVGLNGGNVAGTVSIQGRSSLQCTDSVSQIVFQNGAVFHASQSSGDPFGSTTQTSIRFASGSTYNHNTPAANPFALTAPASVVVFDPGSTYNVNVASGPKPFSISVAGRTFGNLTFSGAWSYGATGSADWIINGTLTVGPSSLIRPAFTGRLLVSGDIVNDDTLITSGRVVLNGTTGQAISGSGFTSFSKGMEVNDPADVALQQALTVGDTLFMTTGKLFLGDNALVLLNPVSGAGSSTYIVTNGTGAVIDSVAAGTSLLFPVGANGTSYNPVTVTLASGDPAEQFAVRVGDAVAPGMADNSKAVQRTWDISEGTAGGNNATLAFQWTAATEGASFVRPQAAAWQYDGAMWNPVSAGCVSGTDPYVFTTTAPVMTFSPFVIANGLPTAQIVPQSLSFGNVSIVRERTDSVYVKNTGSAQLTVSDVSTDNGAFTVVPSTVSIQPSDSAFFHVTFRPTSAGPFAATLRFVTDGTPGSDSTVSLAGTGTEPGFFVEPIALGFGNVWLDSTKTDTLTVTNTNMSAVLGIDSVQTTNERFSVTPAGAVIEANGVQKFAVTFRPVAAGTDSGLVIFYHDAAANPDTVLVYGTGVAQKALLIMSRSSLALGSVRIGHTKMDSLTVLNSGELPLVVSGISHQNSAFQVAMSRDTVQASDSAVVTVTFSPAVEGAYIDTVLFSSNAPEGTDTLFVTATATGVMTIADARSMPNGSDVMIQGIVTRAMGAYTRIQDSTAAIVIYSSTGAFHDSVASGAIAMGDEVTIEGKTSEYNALKEIGGADIAGFTLRSRGNALPAAKLVTLAELDTAGENYESQLVRLVQLRMLGGSGTFAAATTYGILDATDTTGLFPMRIPNASDTDADTVQVPLGTFTYTGVLSQFSNTDPAAGYQLNPVLESDIAADQVSSIAELPSGVPVTFALEQNFPNPFNPSTTIQYALPTASSVKITIYSILGQEVATLTDGVQGASYYRVTWDGKSSAGTQVSSGIYFYRIEARPVDNGAAPFVKVNKMVLLK